MTTTGAEFDANGYVLLINGTSRGTVGVQVDTVLTGLSTGGVTVALGDVAGNCSLSPSAPLSLSILENQTVTGAIVVSCAPTRGALHLTTTSTGRDLDPDGYSYRLDSGTATPVGINAEVYVTGLAAGTHSIVLGGVAANCTASPNSTQSLSIIAGDTVDAGYSVSCAATTGVIRASAATTGAAPDPDGYLIAVDAGAPQAIGAVGHIDFARLAPGSHNVLLSGLAANCSVTGPNPSTATVVAGDTAVVPFNVVCPATGSLAIRTVTAGLSQDPNGYTLSIDGGAGIPLLGTDSVTISAVTVGTHSISLSGIAANCALSEANPRSVSVSANATTNVNVTVTCGFQAGPRVNSIVYTQLTPDPLNPGHYTYDIYAVAPDGTGLTLLIGGPPVVMLASWSPDGSQLVYEYRLTGDAVPAEIRVRNADGSNDHLVASGLQPSWSPDGTRIAYVNNGLWIVNADGTGAHPVRPGAPGAMDLSSFPSWSPDGSRLAFLDASGSIAIIKIDGRDAASITPSGAGRPAWSPDGSRVAFSVSSSPGVYAVKPDGTGYGILVNPGGETGDPTWSPNATQLIFTFYNGFPEQLYRINLDGTGLISVTSGTGYDIYPNWGR